MLNRDFRTCRDLGIVRIYLALPDFGRGFTPDTKRKEEVA